MHHIQSSTPVYVLLSTIENETTSCCKQLTLRLRDTHARAVQNVYLSLLTKNLWYEQREQLDSRGGGALSQGAGHDGSFYQYAV